MRQRGRDACELRVYQGIDPDTGRRRYVTRTVHGTRQEAQHALDDIVAEASYARTRAGPQPRLEPRVALSSGTPDCRLLALRSRQRLVVNDAKTQVDCRTRLNHLGGLELDVVAADVLEHPGAATEEHRHEVYRDLVD